MVRFFLAWAACLLLLLPRAWPQAPSGDPSGKGVATPEQSRFSVEQIAQRARKSLVLITVGGRDGGQEALGTGFVVDAGGLIATNMHVIGEGRPISVRFANGDTFEATEVYASDRALDLAVIRIKAKHLTALALGDAERLRQGQPVVVMGNPHGLRHSVVSGVVSALTEIHGRTMIQLAIPLEPGNSGGPVLDRAGRVQGVVTMRSAISNNLGFAVLINDLKPLLEKPNPIPMSRWMTIGALDARHWTTHMGARWRQRAGTVEVSGPGRGFGGRALCLSKKPAPKPPYEVGVRVRLDDESGAAGVVFGSDGGDAHYGFYPTGGRLRLTRFDGPNVFTWTILETVDSDSYRPGDWNDLKVRVERERLLCYVNDELVIEQKVDRHRPGRVGLAKFRHTHAWFKRFRVGARLPTSGLSESKAAKIREALDRVPPLAEVRPGDLAALIERAPDSVTVIRQRAEAMERKAENLRKLANDVHVASVAARLRALMAGEEEKIDLARGALLIALLDDDEVDVEGYLAEIDRLAADVRARLPDGADAAAKIKALDAFLFAENGFHGSRTDYYHRANSHFNRVIDDREGLPIMLSTLYMEVGRRIGLRIVGVGLPGHFVVRHEPADGKPELIDPFDRGTRMDRRAAAEKVRSITGGPLLDEHLAASTKREIVTRMLRNLLGIAQGDDDKEGMLRDLETLVAINPDDPSYRGMRAVVRFETGRSRAAVADLDWLLKQKPPGLDLNEVRRMRENFFSKVSEASKVSKRAADK